MGGVGIPLTHGSLMLRFTSLEEHPHPPSANLLASGYAAVSIRESGNRYALSQSDLV